MTGDDRKRLNEIAGELEHLPASIKRNFDQDGRDARFLRILAEQSTEQRSEQAIRKQVIAEVEEARTQVEFALEQIDHRMDCAGGYGTEPNCPRCLASKSLHRALATLKGGTDV